MAVHKGRKINWALKKIPNLFYCYFLHRKGMEIKVWDILVITNKLEI